MESTSLAGVGFPFFRGREAICTLASGFNVKGKLHAMCLLPLPLPVLFDPPVTDPVMLTA